MAKMHRSPLDKTDVKTLRALTKQKLGLQKVAKEMNRST